MNKNIKYKIPASLRNLVWNTYLNPELKNGICVCCNTEKISFSNFECGHVISRKDNGETTLVNLRPICSLCNKSMGVMNMNLFIEKYGFNKKIDNQKNINEDLIENNSNNFIIINNKIDLNYFLKKYNENIKENIKKDINEDIDFLYKYLNENIEYLKTLSRTKYILDLQLLIKQNNYFILNKLKIKIELNNNKKLFHFIDFNIHPLN